MISLILYLLPKKRKKLAHDAEYVLAQGGFAVKCWQSSSQCSKLTGTELKQTDDGRIGVLGVSWSPEEDNISFQVVLNFSFLVVF